MSHTMQCITIPFFRLPLLLCQQFTHFSPQLNKADCSMIHNSWVKNKNKNQYIVHFKWLCRGAVNTYYRVAFNCCCLDTSFQRFKNQVSSEANKHSGHKLPLIHNLPFLPMFAGFLMWGTFISRAVKFLSANLGLGVWGPHNKNVHTFC